MAAAQYYGTGRRKTSAARVFLRPGSGAISVNHRTFESFFPREALRTQIRQPLVLTETADKFDVLATVAGGGSTGQARRGTLRIARALVEYTPRLRKALEERRAADARRPRERAQEVRHGGRAQALPVQQTPSSVRLQPDGFWRLLVAIALKDLLEAGVHFGHQTKRWNPKMKEYIFGERNGIYILDLGKTLKLFRDAEEFVSNLAAEGRTILFVGTKRQAQDAIAEEAQRCGMFYVNQRWLGGLLTNFTTIQRSLARLRDLESMSTDGRYDTLSKKEVARLEKERKKLQKNLEGIRGMSRLPDAVFIVDTRKEQIAVDEARKLKIPIIGIVDTNCDPDEVDFVIPGNDDALRSIRLFASRIADAVIAGRGMRESAQAEQAAEKETRDKDHEGDESRRQARRATAAAEPPRPPPFSA